MKKTGIFIIFALSFIFFSCASKPQPQLESDMQASSQNEALIESPAEPIAEPEVLEESDNTLEEIDEPDVRDLPPEEETFASEDDEIEDVESAEDQSGPDANSDADAALQANGTDAGIETTESLSAASDANKAAEIISQEEALSATAALAAANRDSENPLSDSSEDNESKTDSSESENELNTEGKAEDEADLDIENEESTEAYPVSRSVSLKVSEYLDISYPGNGWIFMGATDNSKNITYFGRKLGTQNTNFSLQARIPGTKILHFYKNDNLTNQIIDDYIEVRVLEERGSNQTHVEAPEFKMPVKAKRPVAMNPSVEAAGEIAAAAVADAVSDGVEDVVPVEKKTPQKKNQTNTAVQNKTAASANTTKAPEKEEAKENPSQTQTSPADISALLSAAKTQFEGKDYKKALDSINEYLSNSKDKRDEALFLHGQILEAKSEVQDIAKAIDSYTTLTKNYPASKYWDKANKRIIYLKRFYLQGR